MPGGVEGGGEVDDFFGKGFSPPLAIEVGEFCQQHGYDIDPIEFVAYYSARNWMMNSTPMADWKSAVLSWVKRREQTPQHENPNGNGNSAAEAWSSVILLGIKQVGRYGNVRQWLETLDPAIRAGIKAVGGWGAICDMQTSQQQQYRAKFCASYQDFIKGDTK